MKLFPVYVTLPHVFYESSKKLCLWLATGASHRRAHRRNAVPVEELTCLFEKKGAYYYLVLNTVPTVTESSSLNL
jgi:hypothetical protein